jgi:hypothetical protein
MQQMGSTNNPKVSLRHVHPWRMALSGVVILAAGITIGVSATVVFVHPADPRPRMDPNDALTVMMPRFQRELDLTGEQVDKIKTVLGKGLLALDEIRKNAEPKIEKQLQTTTEDVEKVLTAEQLSNWQPIKESLARRFHRGMPGFGPGRGGPRGGGRGDWPGGPGPDGDRRRGGFGPGDPNGPRPWGGGFGPGDPNGPRGDRPPGFDRMRGPNEPGRMQWRDRREPNDFRPPDRPPRNRDPNAR